MSSVIEAIDNLTEDHAEEYRLLVIRAADDETGIDATEAAEILKGAGKSTGDLRSDMAVHRRREAKRAQLLEAPKIVARWEEAKGKLADKRAECEALIQKCRAELGPLEFAASELQQQVIANNASAIEGELFRDCPDKNLQARYEIVSDQLQRLHREQRAASDKVARAKADLQAVATIPKRGWASPGEREPNPNTAAVEGPQKAVAFHESALTKIGENIRDLQDELRDLHEVMVNA